MKIVTWICKNEKKNVEKMIKRKVRVQILLRFLYLFRLFAEFIREFRCFFSVDVRRNELLYHFFFLILLCPFMGVMELSGQIWKECSVVDIAIVY